MFWRNKPKWSQQFTQWRDRKLACSAGVLLGWVNVKKHAIVCSTGHVWFGFRVNHGERGMRRGKNIHSHTPPLSSFFYCCSPPRYKFLSLPSLLLPLKLKMTVIILLRKFWALPPQNTPALQAHGKLAAFLYAYILKSIVNRLCIIYLRKSWKIIQSI